MRDAALAMDEEGNSVKADYYRAKAADFARRSGCEFCADGYALDGSGRLAGWLAMAGRARLNGWENSDADDAAVAVAGGVA